LDANTFTGAKIVLYHHAKFVEAWSSGSNKVPCFIPFYWQLARTYMPFSYLDDFIFFSPRRDDVLHWWERSLAWRSQPSVTIGLRYIYVRSQADEMASLVYSSQHRNKKVRKNEKRKASSS